MNAHGKLQRIWDLRIRQILARYVPAIDSAQGEVVASDLVEDGIFDLGAIGVFQGTDQIRAFIARDDWPPRTSPGWPGQRTISQSTDPGHRPGRGGCDVHVPGLRSRR